MRYEAMKFLSSIAEASTKASTITVPLNILLPLYVTFHAQLWPRTPNLLLLIFLPLMILIKRHS